jgi:hypothetical protein
MSTSETVARILSLLDASMGREDTFKMRPRLTDSDLLAWEATHGVALPEEYRLFLNEIGDGGMMPSDYCDFLILSLAEVQGADSAAKSFPITPERLRQVTGDFDMAGRPAAGLSFPELAECWQKDGHPEGCLVFGHYPSGDWLLVITTGELRGSVWCSVNNGLPESSRSPGEPVGFLAWFEDALTEFLSTP